MPFHLPLNPVRVIDVMSCHAMACHVSSNISASHLGSCDNLPLVAESRLVG